MSRCFPYPPPGYTRDGIAGHALIESLKLRREAEMAKKEKKRAKKEGRYGEGERNKHNSKKRRRENEKPTEDGLVAKKAKLERELFDRSTITEELTNPSNSQNSVDSNSTSHKLPSDEKPNGEFHVLGCKDEKKQGLEIELAYEGNVFRIRFPAPKPVETSEVKTKEFPPCSTSEPRDVPVPAPVPETPSKPTRDPVYQEYLDLMDSLVPQVEKFDLVESDTDWLFDTSRRRHSAPKSESWGCVVEACHSLIPRAAYSSDAGVYVMPYTIPF